MRALDCSAYVSSNRKLPDALDISVTNVLYPGCKALSLPEVQ